MPCPRLLSPWPDDAPRIPAWVRTILDGTGPRSRWRFRPLGRNASHPRLGQRLGPDRLHRQRLKALNGRRLRKEFRGRPLAIRPAFGPRAAPKGSIAGRVCRAMRGLTTPAVLLVRGPRVRWWMALPESLRAAGCCAAVRCRFKLFARRFWQDSFRRIPIERGVVVVYENARPKRSVRFWVVSIVILGALGVVGWYAMSVFARLLFPS